MTDKTFFSILEIMMSLQKQIAAKMFISISLLSSSAINKRMNCQKKLWGTIAKFNSREIKLGYSIRFIFTASKGFWAEMLGVGDFYYELGVQIIEVCLATSHRNGGILLKIP